MIEEIQSDWVWRAEWARNHAARGSNRFVRRRYGIVPASQEISKYCDEVLAAHASYWEEVTLSATLFFLRADICI